MNILEEKWILRHFRLAEEVASWSKDASTKVGAFIVTNDGKPVSYGFNGMPSGVNDDECSRHERPKKYFYFEHAERNAIYSSPKSEMQDCTIFVTHPPCADCARAIIATKLSRVIVRVDKNTEPFKERLGESFTAAQEMMKEANIEYIEWNQKE